VGDILHPSIFDLKLKLIKEYYKNNAEIDYFLECCEFVKNQFSKLYIVDDMPQWYASYILEGSQGLLLDQNIGFFPHVTRSNVGTKNILEMGFEPHLFLITRAFQTRHGNGPMTNTHLPHNIKDNPNETNVLNTYQGEFKKSLLDLDLLKYGMERDPYIDKTAHKELVITCLDLVKDEYRYTIGGKIVAHSNEDDFVNGIADYLAVSVVHRVSSPSGTISPKNKTVAGVVVPWAL
jgi:adenylosuccinate synthase